MPAVQTKYLYFWGYFCIFFQYIFTSYNNIMASTYILVLLHQNSSNLHKIINKDCREIDNMIDIQRWAKSSYVDDFKIKSPK